MRSCILIATGTCLLLAGCAATLTSDEVAGTWVLADSSRKYLPAEIRDSSPRICLRADGTFEVFELPVLIAAAHADGSQDAVIQQISASGSWQMDGPGGEERILLVFRTFVSGPWTEGPRGFEMFTSRQFGVEYIYYYHGDPDSEPRINFVRDQ